MPKNIKVKFRDHFKVNVHSKDIALFEEELNRTGLTFYVDYTTQPSSGSSVQYYLLNKDKSVIEAFLKHNEIVVLSEAVEFSSVLGEERKFMKLYLRLLGVFIGLLLFLKIFEMFVSP